MTASNVYRAIFFEKPDHIPMTFAINGACWHHYPQEWLCEQMERHKLLFPHFVAPKLPYVPEYGNCCRADRPYTDDFGCVWYTADDGIVGTVKGHPLARWDDFDAYAFPDPGKCMGIGPIDWAAERERIRARRGRGEFVGAGLRHGHTFLQLSDIRGYQNLLFDMADEEPMLWKLIEGVEAFNQGIVDRYLQIGVDMFSFPEDLGMQVGPMLSPDQFRRYIKPSYKRMMDAVRKRGLPIHMHSDGDIRLLADDIVDSGVMALNLQDLVNGIEWIRDKFRGKICIDLDIDRQRITPYGTPEQVDELIRGEVMELSCPDGGLMMIYGLYPGVPMKNAEALMDAMERYCVL